MARLVNLGNDDIGYDLVALIEHVNDPSKNKLPTESDNPDDDKEDETTAQSLYGNTALGKLVSGKKYKELIEKGFLGAMGKILASNPEDIETAFSICFFIIQSHFDAASSAKLLPQLMQALCKDTANSVLRLRLCVVLFNLSDSPAVRYSLFLSLLKYAVSSGNAALVTQQISQVDSWIPSWNLKPAELGELYVQLAAVHQTSGKRGPTQRYLLHYIKHLDRADNKTDKATLAAAKPQILAATLNTIKNTHRSCLAHSDKLLSSSSVKSLSSDEDFAPLYQLLRIFANDSVQAYQKWSEGNKDLMTKHGLVHQNNLRKLRTLTFCSLGLNADKLTFAVLKDKLMLTDASAIESAVIDAVTSGLVEAKIDQENELIIIQRVTHRSFDNSDWKSIHEKLISWQANVSHVLGTLHSAQTTRGLKPSSASTNTSQGVPSELELADDDTEV